MKLNRKNKKGFTIVELVIVIAVIGILSAILIPTFANLTTEAQKAARKQQASDAYTAYLVEATDNVFDGLYAKEGSDPNYTYREVKIKQKAQDKVVLKVKSDSWFTYDSKTGWVESTTEPDGTKNLVVEGLTTYYDAEHNEKADYNQEKASTFNGTVVYYFAA